MTNIDGHGSEGGRRFRGAAASGTVVLWLAGCTVFGSGTSATDGDPPNFEQGDGVCESAEGEAGPPDCAGRFQFLCQNDEFVNFHTGFNKGKSYDDPYQGCADYDPNGDPTEGQVGDWQALARAACSGHCFNVSAYQNENDPVPPTPKWEGDGRTVNYMCDPSSWTDVDYAGKCTELTPLLDLGPVLAALGSEAAEAAAQLPCDLSGDCSELLDYWAHEAMWTPPDRAVRYTADVLAEAFGASVSLLGGPDEELVGQAAYTPVVCDAAACPFYLAQLDLGAYSVVRLPISVDGAQVVKGIEGLGIGLAQPTLGLWLPDTGDVIFPPDSLRLRVQMRITGRPNIADENGTYDEVVQLKQYVFGSLDGERLNLAVGGTDLLGSWSVNAEFEPVAPQ